MNDLMTRADACVSHEMRSEPLLRSVRSTKIQPRHLERMAIVYVRQSTPHQMLEHQESLTRQYDLADHAKLLGWPATRIEVIDEDQGQSGRSAEHRTGFQRLLAEVALEHVGLILGLEMSRLARSSKDWHHLLELCALFGTLLADQDGIYHPCDSNDRLLLGLKGTMSEFELFTMRNRLERGKLHKAERGELFHSVPMGYLKSSSGEVVMDPDEQARAVIQLVFDTFDEIGTVYGLMRYMVNNNIALGVRLQQGPRRGDLEWRRPNLATLFKILHHPLYAGVYVFGRQTIDTQQRATKKPRPKRTGLPEDEWKVLLRGKMPAYITWERYVANQERLRRNRSKANAMGVSRCGCALLAGLLYCGSCGRRLMVHYRHKSHPYYRCERHIEEAREQSCYGLNAVGVDELIVGLVHKVLEPASLTLHLRAIEDSQRERERLSAHWKKRLERARYEAGRSERQYQAVEPENRLVARTLEQKWEEALNALRHLEDDYDRFIQEQPLQLSEDERQQIQALSRDIPALWNATNTTPEDRKDIIRCLVGRIVVQVRSQSEYVDVTIHWHGGFTSQHEVVRPIQSYRQLRSATRLKERILQLRKEGLTAEQIARKLNQEDFTTRQHLAFNKEHVWHLLSVYGLAKKRDAVVLGNHEWLLGSLSKELGMNREKLREWIRKGWVHGWQTPTRSYWIAWADEEELQRIRNMLLFSKPGVSGYRGFPPQLLIPKVRTKP